MKVTMKNKTLEITVEQLASGNVFVSDGLAYMKVDCKSLSGQRGGVTLVNGKIHYFPPKTVVTPFLNAEIII